MNRPSYPIISFLLLLSLIWLGGCSSVDEAERDEHNTATVEELYNGAMDLMAEKEYKEAIVAFSDVEREYPFSEWARRAKLMAAYAAYKRSQYDDVILMMEQYVKLYPADPATPYAFYMIALSYYEQITDIRRDQQNTRIARQALQDVVRRYPETRYARDAKVKLDLVTDHLAGKEMEIGRFYLKRGEYLPAMNRFKKVIDSYQTTNHVPEALHRLVECYLALGLVDDARRSASVLGYNFPGSDWYQDSYFLLTGDRVAKPAQETDWWDDVKDSIEELL